MSRSISLTLLMLELDRVMMVDSTSIVLLLGMGFLIVALYGDVM